LSNELCTCARRPPCAHPIRGLTASSRWMEEGRAGASAQAGGSSGRSPATPGARRRPKMYTTPLPAHAPQVPVLERGFRPRIDRFAPSDRGKQSGRERRPPDPAPHSGTSGARPERRHGTSGANHESEANQTLRLIDPIVDGPTCPWVSDISGRASGRRGTPVVDLDFAGRARHYGKGGHPLSLRRSV